MFGILDAMNNRKVGVTRRNRLRGIALAGLFASCLPMGALAATTNDIGLGSVAIAVDGDYVLTGSSTSNTVAVSSGVTARITLRNLSITSTACAFSIARDATVTLTLAGSNTLQSGERCAGLQVPEGADLVVSSNSTGELRVSGGNGGEYYGGVGIGGDSWAPCGAITIAGGAITAIGGGPGGSGIGAGADGDGGSIEISGGRVTAIGGEHGAGIGTGWGAGAIRISGGTVTAMGSGYRAGIWAGRGILEITGGSIRSVGGSEAVDIEQAPRDAQGHRLYLVELEGAIAGDGAGSVEVEIPVNHVIPPYMYRYTGSGHGSGAIPDTRLYVYLPAGAIFDITVGTNDFLVAPATGVTVDGVDVGMGAGEGWRFDGTFLSIYSTRILRLNKS